MIDPARCDGSLQQTLTDDSPSPCPVCLEPVAVLLIDGRPCLIEHRARHPEALPMPLFPEDDTPAPSTAAPSRCWNYLHSLGGPRRCLREPDYHDGPHEYPPAAAVR
jgi:hypothetical protein